MTIGFHCYLTGLFSNSTHPTSNALTFRYGQANGRGRGVEDLYLGWLLVRLILEEVSSFSLLRALLT